MSGLTNEQWRRIFKEKAPEAFKDCDAPFTISVRNEDGTETSIYTHEGKNDDSNTDR